MAELKTKVVDVSPKDFIKTLKPEQQKIAIELVKVFEEATGYKCLMWGKIFGFGKYTYTYSSGRTGEWMASAFAIRASGVVVYTILGHKNYPQILKKLGKFKDAGKSCLSFKKLEDININVLKELIQVSLKDLDNTYKVYK